MSYYDDAGKRILTDEEIEYLEDRDVDTEDPKAVNEALNEMGISEEEYNKEMDYKESEEN